MAFRRKPKNKIRKTRKIPTRFRSNAAMRIELSCAGALLALAALEAPAQAIQIAPGDCRSGVHLIARDAPLPDVMKRLAQTLGFELRYEGDEGRTISVNTTRPPVELVSSLSTQDSIIVTQAKDPQCPGRNRVVKVWVLPTAQATPRDRASTPVARSSSPAPAPVARPIAREQVIRGSAELEEQSRRAKAAYDEYVRIHGVAPPGVAEEAAKP